MATKKAVQPEPMVVDRPSISDKHSIVVVGDATAGMDYYGPFTNSAAARAWASQTFKHELWRLADLNAPGKQA